MFEWIAEIDGPAATPYEGGKFHVRFEFVENHYPRVEPRISFLTQMFHPNLHPEGFDPVCVRTFSSRVPVDLWVNLERQCSCLRALHAPESRHLHHNHYLIRCCRVYFTHTHTLGSGGAPRIGYGRSFQTSSISFESPILILFGVSGVISTAVTSP